MRGRTKGSMGYLAVAMAITASACGGATRTESAVTGDAAADRDEQDSGDVPDVEGDGDSIEDVAPPKDVEIPPLNFADIGMPILITNQFLFTEGPVWDPARQALFFTDIDGDALYRFTPPDIFEVVLSPAGRANGLALDPAGHLLVAGFGARNVQGLIGSHVEVLVDSYRGMKFNSPDDLVARSDGTIYFTDPTYGIDGTTGPAAPPELGFMGVFRFAPDAMLYREDQTNSSPNGVALSPDEGTLYVGYTSTSEVAAFDVAVDGSLGNKRTFARNLSIPDGMTIDRGGNLYIAVRRGVAVISPAGALLGTISLPQWASNCAFGGADQKTLYITARDLGSASAKGGALYRIDNMPIAGVPGQP